MANKDEPSRSLSVPEVARHYRVREDTVRGWIRDGRLAAVNVAGPRRGRPCWRVMREAMLAFDAANASPQPKQPEPARRRPQRPSRWYPGP